MEPAYRETLNMDSLVPGGISQAGESKAPRD